MKNYSFILLIGLFFIGCQPSSNKNSSASTEYTPDPSEKEDIIVEFDETQGEASIDKNYYFLFDVSGSMAEECDYKKKIIGAKSAMTTFLEKVPDDINMGLLFFGVSTDEYGIEEKVPLGKNNRADIKFAIQNAEPDGGTPLSNAVIYGTNQLIEKYKQQLGYGEYRLIIITDGLASDPDQFKKTLYTTSRYPFIAIYGIGLCMEQKNVINNYALKYTDANNYEELGRALDETLAELEEFDIDEFDPNEFVQATE